MAAAGDGPQAAGEGADHQGSKRPGHLRFLALRFNRRLCRMGKWGGVEALVQDILDLSVDA